MTGSVLLDVAIGIIFALLTFSLIASALQEAIASLLNWRGRMLQVSIRRLLASEELRTAVMRHGLIKGLHGPGSRLAKFRTGETERLPSGIPAATFAKSFIETLLVQYCRLKKSKSSGEDALEAVREMIDQIGFDNQLKRRLKEYIETAAKRAEARDDVAGAFRKVNERIDALGLDSDDARKLEAVFDRVANGADSLKESIPSALQAIKDGIRTASLDDQLKEHLNGVVDHVQDALDASRASLVETVEALQAEIAACFDQAMDRVIGWYVRRTKYALFAIGFVMALVTNFNLIGYAGDLLENDDLRAKMVAQADLVAETGKLAGRSIGQFRANTSTVWYKADTGPEHDQKISEAEIDAILADRSLGPLARMALNKEAEEGVTVKEAQAAYDTAWMKLKPFDENGDGRIEGAEADAAADAALVNLQGEFLQSLAMLNRELGDQRVPLGWTCKTDEDVFSCFGNNVTWTMLLSWLMVGLGCTLGGQFWYDMLKNLMKVRTAAAGVKTALEKPATGGGAGATAGGGGAGTP